MTVHPTAVIYEPVIITKPEHVTIGEGSRVDGFTKLEGGVELRIGRFVHVASLVHLGVGGGTTLIDDYAAVATGGKVISGSNQIDAPSMSAVAPAHLQRIVRSVTRLAPYSCVLANAVVLPGVTLHEGAVLAAGAVATRDVPPWEIWAGVPAVKIADRPRRP